MSEKTRKGKHVRAGYILLETLVALTVVSFGLVALFSVFSSTLAGVEHAEKLTVATLLAEEKLAELKVTPPRVIGISEGSFADSFPGFAWRTVIKAIEGEGLCTVKVEIRWQERGREGSIALISLIPERREPAP